MKINNVMIVERPHFPRNEQFSPAQTLIGEAKF